MLLSMYFLPRYVMLPMLLLHVVLPLLPGLQRLSTPLALYLPAAPCPQHC